MQVCTDCKEEINESNGYKKAGTKGRFMSRCKKCFSSYSMNFWKQRKLDMINLLGGKCADCKQSYHPSVYDFHHLDPTKKDMAWNKMRLANEKRMLEEISKCVLLCSNCHRLRHHS